KYTFGDWASKGLSLSATWADNTTNYLQARCYKVMICDPKDATIPDLAALRTAVAMELLKQVAPGDRLVLEEDRIRRVAEAWHFFEVLIGVCDRDDSACDAQQCSSCRVPPMLESKRSARQPVVGKPSSESSDVHVDVAAEEDTHRLVSAGSRPPRSDSRRCVVNAVWLEEHMGIVRSTMGPHVDQLRPALDVVGCQFNASGLTLDDALGGRSQDDACEALRCFLANIQVWGSLGSLREPRPPGVDWETELFLAKGSNPCDRPELAAKLSRIAAQQTPDRLSDYHRQLSRAGVAHVRREFRQHLEGLRRSLEPTALGDDGQLCAALLGHLRE
ncbi:unnamed protein product, partial [Polarella glacialis]